MKKGNQKERENIPSCPRFRIERGEYCSTEETSNSPLDTAQGTNICSTNIAQIGQNTSLSPVKRKKKKSVNQTARHRFLLGHQENSTDYKIRFNSF